MKKKTLIERSVQSEISKETDKCPEEMWGKLMKNKLNNRCGNKSDS